MNPEILKLLQDAEQALRGNLDRSDLKPRARSHLQHALAHTREAFGALTEARQVRSVVQLGADEEKAARMKRRIGQRLRT